MADVTSTDIHFSFSHCSCDTELLTNGARAVEAVVDAVNKSDLTVVETCFKEFEDGGGVTAAVLLLESHVVIHTWPDRNNTVIGDISVCNYSQNNAEKAKRLEQGLAGTFLPKDTIDTTTYDPILLEDINLKNGYDMKTLLEVENVLLARRSEYQDLKVVESKHLGKVLVLDTIFQTSEKDEFFYHEPLVHVPMLTHPDPREVLIIGGGDGGGAEEVLKHPSVEHCTMIELDREVVKVAQEHLGFINKNVFNNPRFDLLIQDGFAYLQESDKQFDVVILDLTDPIGESVPLYSEHFYRIVRDHLSPQGLVSLHMGMISHDPNLSASIFWTLRNVFPETQVFLNYVPLYGGVIGFALCTASGAVLSAEDVDQRLLERGITDMQFLNGETYRSLFALPNYVRDALHL